MHVQGSLLQDSDGEATRGNNGGNNGAVAGWRWPTRDSSKCLKQQRPAWVVAGRRRLRSRRSRVRIAAGALDSVWVQRPPRGVAPRPARLHAPQRLLDADFRHERAKARIWAEEVEQGCRREEHEPLGALLVSRLQPAQRLVVVPQAQLDECDGESSVAGRAALERREDALRLGALAGAAGYVPQDPQEVGRVASQSRHLSSLRQRLGVAPLAGER